MLKVESHETDVLVIGGGMAGAFAAIRARENDLDVTIAEKTFFGRGGCAALASGAYHSYMPEDKLEEHLKGSGDLVDQRTSLKVIRASYELLQMMDSWGVKFVKDKEGKILRYKTARQDLADNVGLDGGGPAMMMALRSEALRRGVRVVNRVMVTDFLTSDGRLPTTGSVVGAIGFDVRTGKVVVFNAKATVMCAGGYSFPYARLGSPLPSMPINLSGDGIAAELRAGCVVGGLALGGLKIHSVEFHTAPGLEHFTGQGVKWVNRLGQDVKEIYNPSVRGTSTRQTLPGAFTKEVEQGRGPVYLDCTGLGEEQFNVLDRVLPIIMANYKTAGYDLSKDKVPYLSVVAAAHGVNGGGAVVNEKGETSVKGLYAAGSCTNGANARISLSLSECAVLGWWAGESAGEAASSEERPELDEAQIETLAESWLAPLNIQTGLQYEQVHDEMSDIVEGLGTVTSVTRLQQARKSLDKIIENDVDRMRARDPHQLAKVNGLKNCALVARVVVEFLLHRDESRGPIVIEDFHDTDNERWLVWTQARLDDGKLTFRDVPIPDEVYTVRKPQRRKMAHPFFAPDAKA